MKLLKHRSKVLKHQHKVIRHHMHGGSINHLINKIHHHAQAHGGNVEALKHTLKKLVINKPKKVNRIKF
jgi:hypothetical protein